MDKDLKENIELLTWRPSYGDEPIIKVLLKALVGKGTPYYDENGDYAGHALLINNPGLLDGVVIISDCYLSTTTNPFVRVRVLHLADKPVFYGIIMKEKFKVADVFPGHWMNAISRVVREK